VTYPITPRSNGDDMTIDVPAQCIGLRDIGAAPILGADTLFYVAVGGGIGYECRFTGDGQDVVTAGSWREIAVRRCIASRRSANAARE